MSSLERRLVTSLDRLESMSSTDVSNEVFRVPVETAPAEQDQRLFEESVSSLERLLEALLMEVLELL